jgi:hypothetical protein
LIERIYTSARGVFGFYAFVFGLVGFALFAAFGAYLLFRPPDTMQSPQPLTLAHHQPPPPVLQTAPRAELAALRAADAVAQTSYHWADRDHGWVHIPIAEAERLLGERGLAAIHQQLLEVP